MNGSGATGPLPAAGQDPAVRVLAAADLPTRFGSFRLHVFSPESTRAEHVAVVHGDVRGARAVPVGLHSECLTGDVFGSGYCDCGKQLERALETIGNSACGIVLYLREPGQPVGLPDDSPAPDVRDNPRDYTAAAAMLRTLGVESISLLSNNPDKVKGLRDLGIRIEEHA